jgi:hypothetical protein
MIQSPYVVIVAACLSLFAVINLDNILRLHRIRSATSAKREIEKRVARPLLLAGAGTLAFFLESFLYLLLGLWETLRLPTFLDFRVMWTNLLALFGSLVMALGYGIFIWSVIARGQYATSWQMATNQKLVVCDLNQKVSVLAWISKCCLDLRTHQVIALLRERRELFRALLPARTNFQVAETGDRSPDDTSEPN